MNGELDMKIAKIIYHEEDGTWWAESPQFPDFFAAGDSFDECRKLVSDGLRWSEDEDFALFHTRNSSDPASVPARIERVSVSGFQGSLYGGAMASASAPLPVVPA